MHSPQHFYTGESCLSLCRYPVTVSIFTLPAVPAHACRVVTLPIRACLSLSYPVVAYYSFPAAIRLPSLGSGFRIGVLREQRNTQLDCLPSASDIVVPFFDQKIFCHTFSRVPRGLRVCTRRISIWKLSVRTRKSNDHSLSAICS